MGSSGRGWSWRMGVAGDYLEDFASVIGSGFLFTQFFRMGS